MDLQHDVLNNFAQPAFVLGSAPHADAAVGGGGAAVGFRVGSLVGSAWLGGSVGYHVGTRVFGAGHVTAGLHDRFVHFCAPNTVRVASVLSAHARTTCVKLHVRYTKSGGRVVPSAGSEPSCP